MTQWQGRYSTILLVWIQQMTLLKCPNFMLSNTSLTSTDMQTISNPRSYLDVIWLARQSHSSMLTQTPRYTKLRWLSYPNMKKGLSITQLSWNLCVSATKILLTKKSVLSIRKSVTSMESPNKVLNKFVNKMTKYWSMLWKYLRILSRLTKLITSGNFLTPRGIKKSPITENNSLDNSQKQAAGKV